MSNFKNLKIDYGLILAAGRGTRLGEITDEIPKALVKIKDGMKVIDYILKGYAEAGLKKAIIIIAYKGKKIKEYLGDQAYGLDLIYLEQNLNSYGTAAAVEAARSILKDKFFLMSYGDIITQPQNYIKMIKSLAKLKSPQSIMLLNWLDQIKKGGLVEFEQAASNDLNTAATDFYQVKTIKEKPEIEDGGWNSAGIYLFSPEIFAWIDQVKLSKRGEYELPTAVNLMLESETKLFAIKSENYCQDVGTPEDLEYLRKKNYK
jgi:dTDP-glucose pyrophosphorylase